MSPENLVATVADLLKAFKWQITILVGLLLLRKPTGGILNALEERIRNVTRVSIGSSEVILLPPEPITKTPEPKQEEKE